MIFDKIIFGNKMQYTGGDSFYAIELRDPSHNNTVKKEDTIITKFYLTEEFKNRISKSTIFECSKYLISDSLGPCTNCYELITVDNFSFVKGLCFDCDIKQQNEVYLPSKPGKRKSPDV